MTMSTQLIGHIHGKDLDEIRFVFDSYLNRETRTPIELGEILVVEDRIDGFKYLLRVTNIAYGQQAEWSKQIARNYNRYQTNSLDDEHDTPEEVFEDDQKDQLFLEAICEILGMIDNKGRFTSPKRLPSYFSSVRKLSEEDFSSDSSNFNLKSKLGDVLVGKFRSGSDLLDIEAGLFEELLAKHIGVFAMTGGGKSNFVQMFLAKVMELEGRAGLLVFEPHGEYIQKIQHHPLAKEQLVCFAQDEKKGRKLRLAYSDITVAALMNVKEQLGWTEAQERFLREVESDLGQQWLSILFNTPATNDELEKWIEEDGFIPTTGNTLHGMFSDFKEDTIKAVRSKLRQIKEAGYLTDDSTVSNIEEILTLLDQGKVVLIDMASLTGLHELLLSTILSTKVLNRRRHMYASNAEKFEDIPPVAIIMEEAQRVLGKQVNSGGSVFAQICNEGRKFKTGLFAITQQPKLMNEVLISQFNTLVILSISDEKDFHILSSISKKPIDKLRNEIRSLMPGEAIITSPLSPFAMPIKVHFFDDYIKDAKAKYKAKKTGPSKKSFSSMM